jgi:hypothetical protein
MRSVTNRPNRYQIGDVDEWEPINGAKGRYGFWAVSRILDSHSVGRFDQPPQRADAQRVPRLPRRQLIAPVGQPQRDQRLIERKHPQVTA